MATPAFLNSSKYYLERANVVDVQTIIDDFEDQVLANSPAWTNPSGKYQSPIDGYGRFFDVALTRVDAQRLSMVMRDQNAVTIMTRRINIPAANGSQVRIFTGQYHFCIDVFTGADPEYFWGGILDLSPEAQNVHSNYVYGVGSRSAGDVYSSFYWEYAYMLDDGSAAVARRINQYTSDVAGRPRPVRDLHGYHLYQPLMFFAEPIGGGDHRYAGRAYQILLIPQSAGNVGATLTIPIDAGVTGQFVVLGEIPDPDTNGYRAAMRIPD